MNLSSFFHYLYGNKSQGSTIPINIEKEVVLPVQEAQVKESEFGLN